MRIAEVTSTLRLLGAMLLLGFALAACSGQENPAASTPTPSPTAATSQATPTIPPTPALSPEATGTAATPASPAAGDESSTTGTVRLILVPEESEARYRVREQLANQSLPNDAVGATRDVSGAVVLATDGRIVSEESRFEVDLRSLQSDQSRRDNFIQENTLETAQFPTAVFEPRETSGLPWPLPEGGEFTFQLAGDLTVHGATRPVTWDVTARMEGDRLVGKAVTRVTFQDFGMEQPRVAVVLSVEETIQLELDFTLIREQ